MGRKIGEAFLRVRPDTTGFAKEAQPGARQAGEHTGKAFSGAFSGVLKAAGGFVVAAALQKVASSITDLVGGSVAAASDLDESVNAVNKVFGTSASAITAWGKANATSFGLSQRAFQQLATPLGAGLRNAGLSMKDTERFTIDLTKRAADMASVFNVDVEDALAAIQSGLRGEADPLEAFGVGLSAAKVQAQALATTGKKTAASLTEQDLTLARLKLIFDQTKTSAGDFAATSDGLANSQRIAAARTEELQAKIGTKLVPVVQLVTRAKLALISAISDRLLPMLSATAERFQPIAQAIAARVVPAVQALWGWVQDKLLPVLQRLTQEFLAKAVEGFRGLQRAFKDNETEIAAFMAWLKRIADFIVTRVIPVVGPLFTGGLKTTFDILGYGIRRFGDFIRVVQAVAAAAVATKNTVVGGFNAVVSFVTGLPGRIRDALGNLRDLLLNAGRDIIQGLLDGIAAGFRKVKDKLAELTGLLPDWKGPRVRDRRLLFGAGQDIIDSLGAGMSSRFGGIESLLGGLTADIGAGPPLALAGASGRARGEVVVHVYLDGRAIEPRMVNVVKEYSRAVKRAALSGGSTSGRWGDINMDGWIGDRASRIARER